MTAPLPGSRRSEFMTVSISASLRTRAAFVIGPPPD
jgi:hypothetical protein